MIYGLKETTIDAINGVFARHKGIAQVIIYGSRAKGNYRDGSDIDLTIKAPTLGLNELYRIEDELDDLLLPYKIDLSLLHHIGNPDLVAHIGRVGAIFFEASTGV